MAIDWEALYAELIAANLNGDLVVMSDGYVSFLANSNEESAQRALTVFKNPPLKDVAE